MKWEITRDSRGGENACKSELEAFCASNLLLENGVVSDFNIGSHPEWVGKMPDHKLLSTTLNLDVSMARIYYSQRKNYRINTPIERSDVKIKYIKEVSKMVGAWDKVLKEPIFGTQSRKTRVASIYSKMKKGFGDLSICLKGRSGSRVTRTSRNTRVSPRL